MRHAFLIIAHNEFVVLQRLITALDDKRIDIFVHIDKKVKDVPILVTANAGLYYVDNRIDTRWGDVSQIETEFVLFEKAFSPGTYCSYHLISGVHYPIKPLDFILAFYEKYSDKIILDKLCKDVSIQESIKLYRYNFFTKSFSSRHPWIRGVYQYLWRKTNEIQGSCLPRLNMFHDPYKASNWLSLTEDAIQYLIENKKMIVNKYRWTFCGDEFFVPTELYPHFKDVFFSDFPILFQHFGDANPYVLTIDDFEDLKSSECLFARKFSGTHIDLLECIDQLLR